jgi:phloretin hydrolase
LINESILTLNEKTKSYSKYFFMDIAEPPKEVTDQLYIGPMNPDDALSIDNKDELLKPGYQKREIGYCSMEDGTAYLAMFTKMPRVTTEMLDWWFAWHGLESLRYKIWNKEDHFDIVTNKKVQLTNKNIPLNERIWGVTHTVTEDIGFGEELINIHFMSPEDAGFNMNLLKQSEVSTIVNANGDTAYMVHSLRPIDNGVELRSRFWIGSNIKDKKPIKILPEGVKVPELAAKRLALHCAKEFNHLAKILPSLFKEEKDNFL